MNRRYNIDERAFVGPLTPERAYWLGFFMADGNVARDLVQLRLKADDRAHVERFRAFLKSNHPIHNLSACVGYFVRNKRLAASLVVRGVTERKSFTARAEPDAATNSNFWRGVVDGNGHLTFVRGKHPRLELCGSKPLMEQFGDFVCATPKQHKSIWRVVLSGVHAQDVARILYMGCTVALSRKLAVAERMF